MEQSANRIHERIQRRMDRLGIGVTELARRLKARQATVSQWFPTEKKPIPSSPRLDLLSKLPGILGCSGHWLLTGDGPEEVAPSAGDAVKLEAIQRILDGRDADPIQPTERSIGQFVWKLLTIATARSERTALTDEEALPDWGGPDWGLRVGMRVEQLVDEGAIRVPPHELAQWDVWKTTRQDIDWDTLEPAPLSEADIREIFELGPGDEASGEKSKRA